MSDDLKKRLDNLWAMLEAEGYYVKANTVVLAKNRIEELEAKLAKAQGALQQIAGKKDYADDPWGIARTTLAELKVQGDE